MIRRHEDIITYDMDHPPRRFTRTLLKSSRLAATASGAICLGHQLLLYCRQSPEDRPRHGATSVGSLASAAGTTLAVAAAPRARRPCPSAGSRGLGLLRCNRTRGPPYACWIRRQWFAYTRRVSTEEPP
jgi:hypothetical protein